MTQETYNAMENESSAFLFDDTSHLFAMTNSCCYFNSGMAERK